MEGQVKYIPIVVAFAFGMVSMWRFMRTAYAYPDIPRWFYAVDAGAAVFCLFVALYVAASYAEPTP
jgi:hypothetical protein